MITRQQLASAARMIEERLDMERSLGVKFISAPRFKFAPVRRPANQPPHPARQTQEVARQVQQAPPRAPQEVAAPEIKPSTPKLAPISSKPAPVAPVTTPATSSKPVIIGSDEKVAAMKALWEEAKSCTLCGLCQRRTSVVFGEGNLDAKIMFIGNPPGKDDDLKGKPFSGLSGKMLMDIIEKGMKLPLDSVYLCNAIKCRPPGSREPSEDEIGACRKFIEEQIKIISPKIIVTLGLHSARLITGHQTSTIEQLRGNWASYNDIPVMPIYDTTYLHRERRSFGRGNDADRVTWSDIKQVIELLEK